jgi:glycosyltransferase involved in cell wall biosynthesis
MKFDGTPSFELDHRPFFSIVIAVYNGRKFLPRILNSIISQDLREDIEVILCDDHSPDECHDVIEQFANDICIKWVQTDYNCCPGNTRERGIQEVTGEWLMICDQDDELVSDTLLDIKYTLEREQPRYYAYSNFREVWDREGTYHEPSNLIRNMNTNTGWNHGKFYNVDRLWRKFNIHFVKDMKTHEDIYISTIVNSLMAYLNHTAPHIDIYTYIWYKRPGSITNTSYRYEGKFHQFLDIYFNDYVTSTSTAVKQLFLAGNIKDKAFLERSIVETLLFQYFYGQGFLWHQDDKSPTLMKRNIDICRNELIEAKLLTHFKNKDIIERAAANDAKMYYDIFDSARLGATPNIPTYTFPQWLDFLNKDVDE